MVNKQFLDKDGVDYLTQGLKAKIPTKVSQLTNDSGYKTTDNDTKNTAGSTDTSSKIFLIGATSQAANPQTYSHDTAYVGTDGCLYSGSKKVLTDHQSLSGLVPTSRTVNGKALSADITLTASDVGALPSTTTIPTVNNATLTIQKNGTNIKTFTANASTDVTANITVPTKVSELTNDSGFTTNTGTITGIKMNGASKGTSGEVDLGTVITAHQDISGKVNTSDLGITTFKVTRDASHSSNLGGYWASMLRSDQAGSPILPTSTKWWHVLSMDWSGGPNATSWVSQLALPTNDGGVPYYRRNNNTTTAIDSSTWHKFITDENIGEQSVENANILKNLYTPSTRPTDANIASTKSVKGDGGIATFKATGSMTANKPATDSHVMHFYWDNAGGYDTQLALDVRGNAIRYRGQNDGTWSVWKTAAATKFTNSYWGMARPDGTDQDWIRTTFNGIIPYQSGGRTGGHCKLGASSWYFSNSYIDQMHTEKVLLSEQAQITYNSTDKCIEFNFN